MNRPILLIDAFVGPGLLGNPAGVCRLDGPADEAWMQRVALEMNQAETAFLYKSGLHWNLRWFTPTVEVDLCGHATLASAAGLHYWGLGEDVVRFQTRSGELTCTKLNDERFELDFPIEPAGPAEKLPGFESAVFTGKSRMDWLVVVDSEEFVKSFQPNMDHIASLGQRGLILTAPGREVDFVSRFFAPQAGVPEDPVTGSAHCTLAHYWASILNKTVMRARQISSRGGELEVETKGDRVKLRGRTQLTLEGELRIAQPE